MHVQKKRTGRTTHEIKIVGGRGYWRSVSRGARFGTGQDRYPERSVARLCRLWRQIFAGGRQDGGRGFRRRGARPEDRDLTADHQNKPDLATAIARRWYDTEGVDLITELTTSSFALAVQELSQEKKNIDIAVCDATSR